MTTETTKKTFLAALKSRDLSLGTVATESKSFYTFTEATDYANDAYKSGRYFWIDITNCFGQTVFEASREQVVFEV